MQKEAVLGWILDSLSLFGENTKTALLLEMQQQGVVFTPNQFDIEKFCKVIRDILGNHAEFIIIKIVDDFCKYSEISRQELGLSNPSTYQYPAHVLESLFKIAEMAS
jgi:hypothetical protein